MDYPICFSHYFVNKQNVRSFSNIFNKKLLKSKNSEQFIRYIFQKYEVTLPTDIRNIMNEMRLNIAKLCRNDFSEVFSAQSDSKSIQAVDKDYVFRGCSSLLFRVVPKTFFGNNHNSKIFAKCVKKIVYSMRKQHFVLSTFISKWDFNATPWNKNVINIENILKTILIWIFQHILSAIISLNFYVTTCKIDNDENKLYYFWKSQWQSFYDKEISKMIIRKTIFKYEPLCLGKKSKKKYIPQQRLLIKNVRKDIPKLHLILKPKGDVRPIVRYKNGSLNASEKLKIKEMLTFLKSLDGQRGHRLESKFLSLHSNWVKQNKPKLYFIKADLSNAFGSINKSLLLKILKEKMENFQKSDQPYHLKKRFGSQYKELVRELQKPLLVRVGSTIFEWKAGLVQGYVYSPALSEIYYSHADSLYFSEHLKNTETQLKLFIRVVDDYLYVTDCQDDALLFLKALSRYKNVNYNKTAVNFPHSSIQFCKDIKFLGYTFDTESLVVSRASNIYSGQMCYKIVFSASIINVGNFLESRIGQTGIVINSLLFNFNLADEVLIWRHIFLALCISANKFCTILSILCEDNMLEFLPLYKKLVTVKLCNSIVEVLLKNKPKGYLFMFCINHFRYLSWKALLICAKKTSKCNNLVRHIDVEMSKSNCIFGKWREHASVISKTGDCVKPAKKVVCARLDLRKIIKSFEDLPEGFQCYKNIYV